MARLRDTTLFGSANLVSYYELDSGALTTDSKGSNTLTNNNTVGEGTALYGTACADFGTANTNKTLSRADSLGIDISTGHTISVWYKLRTIPIGGDLDTLLRLDSTTGTTRFNFIAFNASQFYWDVSGSSVLSFATTHDTSNWHHLCLVVESGGTCTLYLDNVSLGTQTRGTSTGSSTNRLTIGDDPGSSYLLNAYVDDLAFFNTALTAEQINLIYNGDPIGGYFHMSV